VVEEKAVERTEGKVVAVVVAVASSAASLFTRNRGYPDTPPRARASDGCECECAAVPSVVNLLVPICAGSSLLQSSKS
jgi:hypothetical protein